MPLKANAAYAGVHEPTPGRIFTVAYCDRADNARLNHGLPPLHYGYLRFGWYWWQGHVRPLRGRSLAGARAAHHGPFTSSRLAYQDAMAKGKQAA